ncbi:hypothetical protein GUITHDRAFT_96523 [Guillardia theta CCMP2712]|uniref:Uncharacterized protein n=1 Tax=Guillardia theta (strain CCMP2712) TaxID=905079 RepID=L1IVF2_GUITC|nr:hypothetical protein GUITHDRAFT_96523 [Guillardia theta CCMP2712]EKX39795.1 hypothetical protein GUITHDRAFT_96523 [Guillardia theta CCMP2712]|eukprot:XP_005826775.1 hypothetical protein GUITHDRAFT_96523 [Guillardia theta CCMP2712]
MGRLKSKLSHILDPYGEYEDVVTGEDSWEKTEDELGWFRRLWREGENELTRREIPEDMAALMEEEADPCQDFYEYACGSFIKKATIPPFMGSLSYTWEAAKARVIDDVTSALSTSSGDASSFFRSCMDVEAIEAAGALPLAPWLQAVDEVKDGQTLGKFLGTAGLFNWCALFCWKVARDQLDRSQNLFVLGHVGLTLPHRSMYLDKGHEDDRQAALSSVTSLFLAAGVTPEAEAQRQAVTALRVEEEIAKCMTPSSRYERLSYVHVGRESLQRRAPTIDWDMFFSSIKMDMVGTENATASKYGLLALHDVEYLKKLDEDVLSKFSWDDLRCYLRMRTVLVFSPYLSSPFIAGKLIINEQIYGMSEASPRVRKCYFLTTHHFGNSVSKLFVDNFFNESSKQAAAGMLANIREQFELHLNELDWMDNATRDNALKKLEAMDFQVGYPDQWPDWGELSDLQLGDKPFFDSLVTIAIARSAHERSTLTEPQEPAKWDHPVTSINAYYSRTKNALFIPAGILLEPFFSSNYSVARNYGSLGSILGHEMTHGFDNAGRKYDAQGKRINWWDPQTERHYEDDAACLVEQYNEFNVSGGQHVNGNITLGENIADSGGLHMSYHAFLQEQPKASVYERRQFFIAYAQLWCAVSQPKLVQEHVIKGHHAPKRYRVIGVLRDSQEFSDAFSCPRGSPMNPERKCVVW